MRQLFEVEAGTPLEAFYIESSTLPIRHVLMGRRIMYLHTLLKKNDDELAKRVFTAQNEFPSKKKTDWVSRVRKDLSDCEINLSDTEISQLSSYQFKSLVKNKIECKAMEYLTDLQMSHKKTKYLYHNEKIQEYLTTQELSIKQKKILFKMRTRMCPNKTNFSKKYEGNLTCSLCENPDVKESEIHLLECPFLKNHPKLQDEISKVKYEDIYKHLPKQIAAAKLWEKLFKVYKDEQDKRKQA